MKCCLMILPLCLFCSAAPNSLAALTNVLPGVEFHPVAWDEPGRFLFVHTEQQPPYLQITTNMATLYELALKSGRLVALGRAPIGDFVASADGEGRCVIFDGGANRSKQAFLSWHGRRPTVVELGASPKETVLAWNRVFFCLDTTNGSRILEFTAGVPLWRPVAAPGTGAWQYEDYEDLALDAQRSGALCFRYKAYGRSLVPSTAPKSGWYRYDPATTAISPIDEAAARAGSRFRTAEGLCVFSTEDAGMKAPRTLAIGTYDDELAEDGEPRSPAFKILTKLPSGRGVENSIVHLSPSRRFALVCSARGVRQGKAGLPGWVNTYYAVDLSNGRMTLVLRDSVVTRVGGFMSRVSWASNSTAGSR